MIRGGGRNCESVWIRVLSIVISLCIHFAVHSQSTGKWEQEALVKEHYRSLAKAHENNFSVKKDSVGILMVEITGIEKMSSEFRFDAAGICEESTFIYYCDDCSQKHVDEFLKTGHYRLAKSPGTYYSKWKYQTQIEVFNSNIAVTVIHYTRMHWTRKEYRKLITRK